MEWGDRDAFLLAGRYTLLEQAPIEDLLPKCVARSVSIVVGGPFNSGILAGRDTWNYDTAPPETAALQFPLAHPTVAAVIPGPRDVAEFVDNLKLLQLPIPSALWADLRAEKLPAPGRADPALIIPLMFLYQPN
jgi:D-threo-aldose 1-dehydrogenase